MKKNNVILVTGASSGIGLLIANRLHDEGFTVYGTSRNPEKHRKEVPFRLLSLDVTSDRSIHDCIEALMSEVGTIDVLVNNAGGLLAGSVEETAIEQAYKQFETNFWGSVKMTKAVLPIMRSQRSGKIITISSLIGLIGVPFNSYYAASKHALEGFYKSLRLELRPFNIKVSVVEPGFFKTNIDREAQYGNESISDYEPARKKVFQFFSESLAKSPAPKPVADVVLKIVNEKAPKYNYPVGARTRLFPAIQFFSHNLFETGFLKRAGLE
jgi:NAD(P)-dependent dehydrogenase (short-subunit alcohol dehydrogenase family)